MGIIGVLIIVIPAPNAKVSINSIVGVVRPTKVSIPSRADIVNKYAHAIRSIRLGYKRDLIVSPTVTQIEILVMWWQL